MKTTEYNLEQFLRGHRRLQKTTKDQLKSFNPSGEYPMCEDSLIGDMVSTSFRIKKFFFTVFTEYIHKLTEHHDIFILGSLSGFSPAPIKCEIFQGVSHILKSCS